METKEMFGLFEYSYDYYEWEELVCASESKDSLVAKYNSIDNGTFEQPLIDESEHKEYASNACWHYSIIPIIIV